MKDVLKYGLLAVGGYWLYSKYFSSAAPATATATPTTTTPTTAGFSLNDLVNALRGGSTATTQITTPIPAATCPTGQTGTPPNCVVVPPAPPASQYSLNAADYGSQAWIDRVSSALTSAAGGNGRKVDEWAWYFNRLAGNNSGDDGSSASISPALMQGIVDMSVGNDARGSQAVLASDWVATLIKAKTSGLSGLRGPMRVRIPVMVVTLPGGKRALVRAS